jgi:hypothetical protein
MWDSQLEPLQRWTARIPRGRAAWLAVAVIAAAFAVAATYAVPRAVFAFEGLSDPARIAGHALDGRFDAQVAQREIEAALAARDAELAQSFVDLAGDRHVAIDPALAGKVNAATAEAATTRYKAASFARGLITGEPNDMAALAGTTLGDLFVFGDIRDALREGKHLAAGEQADELVLGLACVGIAITAGTYATFGAAAPARVGLTLAKAARKAGSLTTEFAASLGPLVRRAVDWRPLRQAATNVSIAQPALAERAAREAVKVERAGGLLQLAGDLGRVERSAGGRAALDGLKIAKEPRDVARVARLAEKEGSRTRAILKVAGRGAITIAAFAFDAAIWLLGAAFAVLGFVSALKNATERAALRIFRRRRERRARREMLAIAAIAAMARRG